MPKVNGFVMYMESVRSQVAPGQSLKRNELALLCTDGWKELPEEQKKKFTERAKLLNERNRTLGGQGSAPKSIPKKVSEDPEKCSDSDHGVMDAGRKVVCQIFKETDWRSQPIVVCHFSMYCEPDYADHFIPAEVGLATFSLQEGVTDNFSRIIDPGKIPLGYGIEAVHTAVDLGLPPFGTVPEFADYDATMMIIDSYLQQYKIQLRKGSNMYVFAFDSEYVRVKRCFEWLFQKTGYRFPVQILSLDLWCYMSTTYSVMEASKAPVKNVPGAVFKKDGSVHTTTNRYREPDKPLIGKFVYHSRYPMCAYGIFLKDEDVDHVIRDMDNYRCFEEMCCIYHLKNGLQIQHCALNMANRYAFSILEIITISNEVPLIRGNHFPEIDNPPVEKARRYNMLRKWGITTFEQEMEVRDHEEKGSPTPPGRGFGYHPGRRQGERNDERRNRGPPRRPREQLHFPETLREVVLEEVEEAEESSPPTRAPFVRIPGGRNRRDCRGASSVPEDSGFRLYRIREESDEEEPRSGPFMEGQASEEKREGNVFSGNVPSIFIQPQGGASANAGR